MATELTRGMQAPDFTATAYDKKQINLRDYRGKPVWLIFYRYPECPLCNLHLSTVCRWYSKPENKALSILAVFESKGNLFPYAMGGKALPSFPLIADPNRELYELYGTQARISALLAPSVVTSLFQAFGQGFKQGKITGKLTQIPAHFLISAEGIIDQVFHGKTVADHIPWKTVDAFVTKPRRVRSNSI